MRSSYIQNNYDDVLFSIVTAWRPTVCVELGVLDGYSTIAIGKALKYLADNKFMTSGHLDAYDLFDEYEFKHGDMNEVLSRIGDHDLIDHVSLNKMDAFDVHEKYQNNTVYFLHVDISNTGETVKKIMDLWDPKMVVGGIILFEGGTEERDEIEWMKKYNVLPIKPEIESNPIINSKYVYGTYLPFPGMTMLLKKRE
jgi:hypothetical protein